MKIPPSWFTFGVLQVAVFALGFAGLCLLLPLAFLLLWPGTLVAGVVLAIKGYSRARSGGMAEGAFVRRLVGVLVLATVGWIVALLIAASLPSRLDDALGWDIISVPALAVFSAGSLAFMCLGPFRSQPRAMDRVRQLIANESHIRLGLRATADQIAQAEQRLGLRLPASFVEFLTTWGGLEADGTRVLGVPPASEIADAVDGFVEQTLAARTSAGLPPHFVVCVVYAGDRYVCLDTFSMQHDEAPAVLWNGSSRAVTQILGPTFGDFLRDQLQSQLTARRPR